MACFNLLKILLYCLNSFILCSVGFASFLINNFPFLFDEINRPVVNQGSVFILLLLLSSRSGNEESKAVLYNLKKALNASSGDIIFIIC